jgi:hypothetical protein
MSGMTLRRGLAGAALWACCTVAQGDLLTYHVDAVSHDSVFGVPGGIAVVLEFTIDDAVPPSFSSPEHTEYVNSMGVVSCALARSIPRRRASSSSS